MTTKEEARKRLKEFPGAGALGLTLELMTIEDVDYLIDRTRKETLEEASEVVSTWVEADTEMPDYMKSAIDGFLKAIAKRIKEL